MCNISYQVQLVQNLQRAVTPANAHAYMSAALGLGLGKVVDAATRVAATGLDKLPLGACDGMSLDAVERHCRCLESLDNCCRSYSAQACVVHDPF